MDNMERNIEGNETELIQAIGAIKEEVVSVVENWSEQLELERRMKENPYAVLGIAAAAGFTLGGGLWPLIRPFVKGAVRGMLSPPNLIALATAVGALRAKQMKPSTETVGHA
jgi:hypothetical protein